MLPIHPPLFSFDVCKTDPHPILPFSLVTKTTTTKRRRRRQLIFLIHHALSDGDSVNHLLQVRRVRMWMCVCMYVCVPPHHTYIKKHYTLMNPSLSQSHTHTKP